MSEASYSGDLADASKRGRPTLLTPELAKEICDHVKKVYYVEAAAGLARVAKQRIYAWLQKGEAELIRAESGRPAKSPNAAAYIKFYVDFTKANAETEAELLEAIRKGEPGWQARAWVLERTRPDRYSLPDRRREAELLHRIAELEANSTPTKRKKRV